MGKGKSSDVYIIVLGSVEGRRLTMDITPTSAGSIELPSLPGVEGVIVGWIWEKIPYNIRSNKKGDDDIFSSSVSWNGIDISEWWQQKQKKLPVAARDDPFTAWKAESKEVQAQWIAKDRERKMKKQEEFMEELSKDKSLPPLAELSVDDICSDMSFTWRYIQSIRLLSTRGVSESEDQAKAYEDPVTGTYEVILTSPKWIRAIDLFNGESGTTAYDRPMDALPAWSRELHRKGYTPVAFTLRVIVLLMARLPRHAPNPLSSLPLDVLYVVIAHLWKSSHDEHEVPQWEVDWLEKRQARLQGTSSKVSKGKKNAKEPSEKKGKRKSGGKTIEKENEEEESEEEEKRPRRSPRVQGAKKK